MKKTALFLIITAICMMAIGDALARGPRPGGRSGMHRPPQVNRPNFQPGTRSFNPNFQPGTRSFNPNFQPGINPQSRNLPGNWPNYAAGKHYPHHPYPHHHPHYPGWRPRWWAVPVAWGVGTAWWNWNTSGYSYYNPYAGYIEDQGYDYTDPVYANDEETASQDTSTGTTGTTTNEAGLEYFQEARTAFKQEDYQTALQQVNKAIQKMPNDAALHEFRGLTLFQLGRYNQAAAVINSVLASGPGWDWDTMIGLYRDPEQYTTQLRNLEKFTKRYPDDAAAHFLLAYHYLITGFTDNAKTQLKQVVRIQPRDVLAKRILGMIESSKEKTGETATPPTPQS